MAIPRHARVAAIEEPGTGTRLLELVGDDPLGFTGGQYIIVDSGLVLASGKAVKRAYSMLSPDAEQGRFQIAVKRIPGGPGSGFMHQIGIGDDIRFSGPWGRFFPQNGRSSGPALVLATDTGITAALGLVQGSRFKALAPLSFLIWLRTAPDYFLPEALVRDRSPPHCTRSASRRSRPSATPSAWYTHAPSCVRSSRACRSSRHSYAGTGRSITRCSMTYWRRGSRPPRTTSNRSSTCQKNPYEQVFRDNECLGNRPPED
jgi:hypothetical protein